MISLKNNLKQKDNCQKLISEVTKEDIIIFHALSISAPYYSFQGDNWWNIINKCNTGNNMWLSDSTMDFNRYMNLWIFKNINQFIPSICKDKLLKETDDWWRLKTWVETFLKKKKEKLVTYNVLYFMRECVQWHHCNYKKLFVFLVFNIFIYDPPFICGLFSALRQQLGFRIYHTFPGILMHWELSTKTLCMGT